MGKALDVSAFVVNYSKRIDKTSININHAYVGMMKQLLQGLAAKH